MTTAPLRRSTIVAAALALLAAGAAPAAQGRSIQAEIDRSEATTEDQLVLTVTVVGSQSVQPVLPALDAFEVVPAGQSKQWSFVNGRPCSSVSYRYLLLPRRAGEFVIGPAVAEIDGERLASQPFSVRVLPAGSAPRQRRDLFLTTELSTTTPYVGQQVLFTWRLYRRVRIADARLDPFEFDGFLVEDLGEVREFETTVNGQKYLVSEIRKALFPQEQGELTIPATRLTCEVMARSQRRPDAIFEDIFGRSATETRVLRSDAIQVQVRPLPPPPPAFSGLVGSFKLSASVSQREVSVGESITLVLEVSGSGNVQMIPEPAFAELPFLKVYDDKPSANIERRPSGLSGSKMFRKAIVPQIAGEITLPRLELVYFDPEAGKYRTASSAEIALDIEPPEGREELRLTETLAPSTGKVAVRILAEDILPLYAGVEAVTRRPRPTPPQLAGMLLTPPALYLGLLAAVRRRRRLREDAGLERRRRARARVRRRLRRLAARDGGSVEELSRCLREFIGDKLGLEGVALTPAEARQGLIDHGLDEAIVEEAGRLLTSLEAAQYGAAAADGRDLCGQVADLVRRLEKKL